MKKFLNVSRVLFAALALSLLAVPTGSFAQTVPPCIATSTFDTFATGTVNGQGGWNAMGTYDQEVVSNTFGHLSFGCKSLRISDATTSPFIFNQTFSNLSANEAGETDALSGTPNGTRQSRFEAQFDLASVTQNEQPGMHISVSPDRGDGTRMSSLGLIDTAAGIEAYFTDVTGTADPVTFRDTASPVAILSRTVPHTIKFLIDFVDGASNDIVKIFVDDVLVHTGTSWENFYRYSTEAFGGPTPNSSRTVNSLVFQAIDPPHLANQFNGYLIDNVFLSSTSTPVTGTTTPPASTTTPPVITLNGSSPMNIIVNTTFTDPGATATDDIDATVTVNATGTVDTSVIGTYTITYSATDSNNNTASTTRTVNVVAAPASTSTVPIITLNGSSTISIFINSVFSDPGATAVSGTTTVPVTATGTVDTATLGTYTILYTATSTNDDIATTTRTVSVVSTSTPPTITLNGSSTVNVTQNTAFTDISPGATAVDAIGTSLSVTATGTVNTAAVGSYVITYTATDTNNNVATTTRTVNVVAAPAPAPAPAPTSGGGGGGGGIFYPPVPGMPVGFVYAPLPGQNLPTIITGSQTTGSPIVTGTVSAPTGQVLGVTIFNFTRNLGFGSRGLDVMELQKILIASGHLVLNTPTQYFGTLTRAALRKWQAQHGIIATGFFGPLSRAAVLRQ